MSDARYTHGHEAATLASHGRRTAQNSCAYLLPHLAPGMRVLDVGCGPGSITLDLAEVVAPGEVTGVENVDAPLAVARDSAAQRGDTTTRFEIADALDLHFADDTFDVVHTHQVLQHVPDPVRMLCEMRRVCRPGGIVAAREADYAAMAWYPAGEGLDQWRDLYSRIARSNGGEPDAGRHLRAWVNAAGYPDATFSTSVWTYADTESTAWWGTSQADRVSAAQFRAQAAEHGASDQVVDALADAWRTWGAQPDAWFMLPHVELVARV